MSAHKQQEAMVQRFVAGRIGADSLISSRALSFGGAGSSLAIILLFAQIGIESVSAEWSLGLAVVSLPFWLSLALTNDVFLSLKLNFTELSPLRWLWRVYGGVFFLSLFCTFASVALLLLGLAPIMALFFAIASFFAFCMVVVGIIGASSCILNNMTTSKYRDDSE